MVRGVVFYHADQDNTHTIILKLCKRQQDLETIGENRSEDMCQQVFASRRGGATPQGTVASIGRGMHSKIQRNRSATKEALKAEKDHVEVFAAEVAWMIKSGDTDMDPPIAIRSTSETVMYPCYTQVGHVAHVM